ncbi:MAG: glycosyltransferase family 4 protein [Candidatus Pacebacteria bacterium]|nr:glycosyltransferase family 4 protein [Candidatus Paceibacterota bacterium]
MSSQEHKKYKIGIDARMHGYAQTGIGNYIRHLLQCIFETDKKNEYVIFLMPEEYDKFNLPNKRIKKIKVSSKWYGWKEQLLFPFQLYKENLDLMHFTHFNSPILYFKRSIVTIHDITPYFFPGHKMRSIIRKIGFKTVFFSSVKKASKVIAVSENTKNDIANYFKIRKDKINVIYEGTDSQFRVINDDQKIADIKKRYNITKPFIFYTGVWRNHKNLVGLIKAFGILKNKYKLDYQLVLGGKEDPYYPEVRETWEKLRLENEIIRTGFIDQEDLPLFYNAAEVFVIPSFYEGFGLIGLEAFACETPVISSNTTSLPEVLGNAAMYFNPKNTEEMAERIKLVLTDKKLYNELKEKGFKQIEKYSWKKMGRETMDVYREILGN